MTPELKIVPLHELLVVGRVLRVAKRIGGISGARCYASQSGGHYYASPKVTEIIRICQPQGL